MASETVLIIDFGGQYKELIARRVRECGVYSVIKPHTISAADVSKIAPIGIIFTGGPGSVTQDDAPTSVSLLLFVPENMRKPETPRIIKAVFEEGYRKNPQVFLKWQPNTERDFLYYRVWRRPEGESQWECVSDNPSINTAVYTDMSVTAGRRYFYSIQAVNASMMPGELSEEMLVETK